MILQNRFFLDNLVYRLLTSQPTLERTEGSNKERLLPHRAAAASPQWRPIFLPLAPRYIHGRIMGHTKKAPAWHDPRREQIV